jgi:PAS domain S-box-containing protein
MTLLGGSNPSSQNEVQATTEDLKQHEASLRESQERFRQMAENIQEIFWMLNSETKEVLYVSPACEPICELSVESLYANPKAYRELIHPEDREHALKALDQLGQTNRLDEEFRIICPSGRVKWLRAMGFTAKDLTGTVKTYVGTAQEITARKEMEAALREREDRYRDLVENATDLICTHTLDGRLLSVNELPAKLLGYSVEELLNKPMRDFFLPEARAQFDESLVRIQKEGFVKGLMVVLTKSGERRIWEYYNTLRTDGVSTPIVRGIAHDVTEQKRIERALRLSEEKFSKAFRLSPNAIVISKLQDEELIEFNDKFLHITGFSREESIGHTSLELGLWASADEHEGIVREIKNSGRVQKREIALRTKAGEHRIVSYSAEVIELDRRKCLLSVYEDITESKRAEARLREYETAVEGVEEMIAVVDCDYRYILANEAFAKARCMEQSQVVGRHVRDIVGGEFFERVAKEKLEEAFRGKIVRYEVRFAYPEIGLRDVLISCFPIEGNAGVRRIVCVLQDITDRKKADEELRRLSGQLLRLQDEERRKIARDLHDSTGQDLVALETTLNHVYSAIPAANRKTRKLVAQCQAIAERSLREVRTLSYVLHPPMLDEAGLEDAVRHYADGFTTRTGIDLTLEISPQFGRLQQDTELGLFRVVQESLTNIQRHSGSYTAKIQLVRELEKIKLVVSDTGRGIPATRKNGEASTAFTAGVGIPSMEERVKQVGGELEIDSSHFGTTVRVTVPIHE